MAKTRPGLLVILDGFALGDPDHPCNAFARASRPTFDRLLATRPWTTLGASGPDVGLPEGQMGNSEVGHLNIGAGRLVLQDIRRISADIQRGAFGSAKAYDEALAHLRRTTGRLHLMGLLGPGGVHAHEDHFAAALRWAASAGLKDVLVHPVGDGRDTPPTSALGYLETLRRQIAQAGVGRIASFVGRYYAMDRDARWERTEAAYRLYTEGKGHRAADAVAAVEAAYARGETDEFVAATLVDPEGVVRPGDAVLWLNFRPDRSRQITRAFMEQDFTGFTRRRVDDLLYVCTTQYDAAFAKWPGVCIAYGPERVASTLAEQISLAGLQQFHAAETEKYAHVTYFLNGGREEPFPGEDRRLVPSPKVATYDLVPEMSAGELTDAVLAAMGNGYDLVVVNYANPDMVGHTGKLAATVKAVEFVDNCINRLVAVADELGFVTLITADHGNCELMCKTNPDGTPGEPVTKHTLNRVPLIVSGADVALREGRLSNVAPTLLRLMGMTPPKVMEPDLLA